MIYFAYVALLLIFISLVELETVGYKQSLVAVDIGTEGKEIMPKVQN